VVVTATPARTATPAIGGASSAGPQPPTTGNFGGTGSNDYLALMLAGLGAATAGAAIYTRKKS
jgi:LPXTG-motif cell wall-anchored protein